MKDNNYGRWDKLDTGEEARVIPGSIYDQLFPFLTYETTLEELVGMFYDTLDSDAVKRKTPTGLGLAGRSDKQNDTTLIELDKARQVVTTERGQRHLESNRPFAYEQYGRFPRPNKKKMSIQPRVFALLNTELYEQDGQTACLPTLYLPSHIEGAYGIARIVLEPNSAITNEGSFRPNASILQTDTILARRQKDLNPIIYQLVNLTPNLNGVTQSTQTRAFFTLSEQGNWTEEPTKRVISMNMLPTSYQTHSSISGFDGTPRESLPNLYNVSDNAGFDQYTSFADVLRNTTRQRDDWEILGSELYPQLGITGEEALRALCDPLINFFNNANNPKYAKLFTILRERPSIFLNPAELQKKLLDSSQSYRHNYYRRDIEPYLKNSLIRALREDNKKKATPNTQDEIIKHLGDYAAACMSLYTRSATMPGNSELNSRFDPRSKEGIAQHIEWMVMDPRLVEEVIKSDDWTARYRPRLQVRYGLPSNLEAGIEPIISSLEIARNIEDTLRLINNAPDTDFSSLTELIIQDTQFQRQLLKQLTWPLNQKSKTNQELIEATDRFVELEWYYKNNHHRIVNKRSNNFLIHAITASLRGVEIGDFIGKYSKFNESWTNKGERYIELCRAAYTEAQTQGSNHKRHEQTAITHTSPNQVPEPDNSLLEQFLPTSASTVRLRDLLRDLLNRLLK